MSLLKRGKPIVGQSREIIYNVHQFMQIEAQKSKDPLFNVSQFKSVMERTARATGISRKTVSAIAKEKETASTATFKTPKKGRRKLTHRAKLDDYDYQVIRQRVYNLFYTRENKVPTVKDLLSDLQRNINFNGGQETLRRILNELGFEYKKTESNKKIIAEKDEIRLLRIKYLQEIKRYRHEGRNIVYGDETYVLTTLTNNMPCTDEYGREIKQPAAKKQRLIIVHAGGSNGFVPGALLIQHNYKTSNSQLSSGDTHHDEMTTETYEKWVKNQLIPNLPLNSVLVIGNASYHNNLGEKTLNSNSRKCEMQEWLRNQNIQFNPSALKPELYKIIKINKNECIQYSIDNIMEEHGHKVLRVPNYHPDFNPLKKIWVQVKGYVTQHSSKFNSTQITQLLHEKISLIDVEAWRRVVDEVIKCEDEFLALEQAIDDRLDQFVFNTGDSSSSDDGDDSGDDEMEDLERKRFKSTLKNGGENVEIKLEDPLATTKLSEFNTESKQKETLNWVMAIDKIKQEHTEPDDAEHLDIAPEDISIKVETDFDEDEIIDKDDINIDTHQFNTKQENSDDQETNENDLEESQSQS